MWTLIKKLHRIRLLSFAGFWHLSRAIATTGINLMALLRIAAKLHPDRIAVVDERGQLTYRELWEQAESLARGLHVEQGIQSGQKVALICRNHIAAVQAIFAVSRLGSHLYLLNPEMSPQQILQLEERWNFDFFIYDPQLREVFQQAAFVQKSIPAYDPTENSIDRLSNRSIHPRVNLSKTRPGNIVVLTGGTTGQPKPASRKPSLFAFLPPFMALLCKVQLDTYRSVYIATPIYHGFGLASLFIGVVLATEMHFTTHFHAEQACQLIAHQSIEATTVVPLMLMRMLQHDPESLSSLRCIITGGAALSPSLAQEALQRLGPTLFNLYGTSEAGVCIMATPSLLARKPESIGKPIWGVRSKIVDGSDPLVAARKVGRLCIASSWAISRNSWIETGDVAYQDSEGDLFLCGRVDDMVVSGGENVYPVELESVLVQHPDVESAAVVGIPDREFGQRLKAVVVCKPGRVLDELVLLEWLKTRIARHQMPLITEFRDELPYTRLGKVDKLALQGKG